MIALALYLLALAVHLDNRRRLRWLADRVAVVAADSREAEQYLLDLKLSRAKRFAQVYRRRRIA